MEVNRTNAVSLYNNKVLIKCPGHAPAHLSAPTARVTASAPPVGVASLPQPSWLSCPPKSRARTCKGGGEVLGRGS